MKRGRMSQWASVLAALAWTALAGAIALAEPQLATDFKAEDRVQTLTVRIDVGPGDALTEPVALDLGLGFPFWLQPIGRGAKQPAPFGAVPQEATAQDSVPAGTSATFTFSLQGLPGQDAFRMTPQLLADVRMSDISRVGLASPGKNDWVLDGYEIQINGHPFAAGKALGLKSKQALDAARAKLAELRPMLSKLAVDRAELKDLAATGLANADDQKALGEAEASLATRLADKNRLEGQLQGLAPWFVDADFRSPWRTDSSIKSVRVVVETQNHTGAGTGNYVYFSTGGHKYLLGSPEAPLTAAAGPQAFPLNLGRGPLGAADLRGWAVGMLAPADPSGKTSDRWHPARILVHVDDRVTYDSEENQLDRDSLQAIRLIPPAQSDDQGNLVINQPNAREAFVWTAGKGQGLDASGQAVGLPNKDEPGFPQPEAGAADQTPPDDMSGAMVPMFPGEMDNGPLGWYDSTDPSFQGGGDVTIVNIFYPPPQGQPFQIESVKLTAGWKANDSFTVQWSTSGDEGQIDHYVVSLLRVRPENPHPYVPVQVFLSATAPSGTYQFSGAMTSPPAPSLTPMYVAPMVVAVPSDPLALPHLRFGPARALFPAGVGPATMNLTAWFQFVDNPSGPHLLALGGQPPGTAVAVWRGEQMESHHTAIFFDGVAPGHHLGVRPASTSVFTRTAVEVANLPASPTAYHVVGHLGFVGGPTAANHVTVEFKSFVSSLSGPGFAMLPGPTLSLHNPAGGPPNPLLPFDVVIGANAGTLGFPGPYKLHVDAKVTPGPAVDPTDLTHPPALYGVRILH